MLPGAATAWGRVVWLCRSGEPFPLDSPVPPLHCGCCSHTGAGPLFFCFLGLQTIPVRGALCFPFQTSALPVTA